MSITKGDLINYLGEEAREKIDVAMPLDWVMDVKHLGIDPSFYVMDYRKNPHGKPLDLLMAYAVSLEQANAKMFNRIVELQEKLDSLKKAIDEVGAK